MTRGVAQIRFIAAMVAFAVMLVFAAPVGAQQPVNPTASSVKEEQLLQQLKRIQGRGTIPDTKSYVIEQPEGRDWRHFHEVTLRWIGAVSIIGMLVVLVGFYLIRGMVRLESGRSGRVLVRFNAFQRLLHLVTGSCFVVLAISSLHVNFGNALLLPPLGPRALSPSAQFAQH